jgi:formate hydrogenlyase subunit 3/multisubunit Na+/H+ antiporter MnhD subunit
MDYMVANHVAYIVISVAFTIWVARTLHKNGRIFLVDAFSGNEPLADSINHLLVVGFYLINFGYDCFSLKSAAEATNSRTAIESLSTQIGGVLLVLGGMHFFNLYVFNRMRRRGTVQRIPMPVAPVDALPVR